MTKLSTMCQKYAEVLKSDSVDLVKRIHKETMAQNEELVKGDNKRTQPMGRGMRRTRYQAQLEALSSEKERGTFSIDLASKLWLIFETRLGQVASHKSSIKVSYGNALKQYQTFFNKYQEVQAVIEGVDKY